uniref:Uncharacterized protein n=1 Tax=Picea glauca TaxID=3330 RepID=A0A117NHI4_PICGL|nr:hypothetical protein ABT39_MTgene5350 [Picea glauca]
MRKRCIEYLAHFYKQTLGEIKRRFGSNLERANPPFISEKETEILFTKLLFRYAGKRPGSLG